MYWFKNSILPLFGLLLCAAANPVAVAGPAPKNEARDSRTDFETYWDERCVMFPHKYHHSPDPEQPSGKASVVFCGNNDSINSGRFWSTASYAHFYFFSEKDCKGNRSNEIFQGGHCIAVNGQWYSYGVWLDPA